MFTKRTIKRAEVVTSVDTASEALAVSLAEKAKISRSHLSSIEAPNIIRSFSLDVLYNIADALDIEPGDLLNTSLSTKHKA